jgi:hypothetical protein
MLSDRHRQLLTAYLDGQLSPRQRKAALRLLRKSSAARELYEQLQKDSHDLIQLPRQTLPREFAQEIVRAINERGLRVGQRPPTPAPRPIPAWLGLGLAAAILVSVGTASYLYFADRLQPGEGMAFSPFEPPELPPIKDLPPPRNPFLGRLAAVTVEGYAAEVGVRVPLTALSQEKERGRLTAELRKGPAYHLDLDCASGASAVQVLSATFKENGFPLHIEAAAQARLKKRQPKTTYVVYAEGLRPDQLVTILQRLGREAKGTGGSRRTVQGALLNPMSDEDRQHLSRLLGVPPGQLQPSKEVKLRPPPIHVPGDPKAPKGQPNQPPPAEGFAVVLAFDGPAGRPSRAIQQLLHGRRTARPGLQVYMVLHEASA